MNGCSPQTIRKRGFVECFVSSAHERLNICCSLSSCSTKSDSVHVFCWRHALNALLSSPLRSPLKSLSITRCKRTFYQLTSWHSRCALATFTSGWFGGRRLHNHFHRFSLSVRRVFSRFCILRQQEKLQNARVGSLTFTRPLARFSYQNVNGSSPQTTRKRALLSASFDQLTNDGH